MANSSSAFTLGLEGGGTKTTWALVGPDGVVGKSGKTTAGNVQLLSDAQLRVLFKSIRTSCGPAVHAIGAAFAGCHLPNEKLRVETALRHTWPGAKNIVVGEDTRSAFAGAHGHGPGIIVIAGTGSNVQGHKNGRWEKAGGWGHLFADPGSGYDLARRALEKIYAHYDQTNKVPPLGQALLHFIGQNTLEELVPWILQRSSKTEVAGLVPCVFDEAKKGDALAKAIIKGGAEALADRVQFIAQRLGLKKPDIGLVGSLFEKEIFYFDLFRLAVKKRLAPGRIFVSETPGEIGAARLISANAPLPITPTKSAAIAPEKLAKATTEQRNQRSAALDQKSIPELVDLFIEEERHVRQALREARTELIACCELIAGRLAQKGRLFYVGAGTSGRLGVLDASEMPPTFGVPRELVQGIIAGGFEALHRSIEGAEDDTETGAQIIAQRGVKKGDVVCGITASGNAPFVRAALIAARKLGAETVLLTCNAFHEPLPAARFSLVLSTGPEIISGSTRLKAGTATKLTLNMFSSIAMIRSGRVRDNLMIHVQPTNAKLRLRAVRLVMSLARVSEEEALLRLKKTGWDVYKATQID